MTTTPPQPKRGWLRWLLIIPLLLLCSVATAFAFLPAAEDPIIPAAQQGGGARQRDDAISGLDAPWPDMQPVSAEQSELGWLLFYDPVLSGDNTMACATCHHPDQGFSDGRQVGVGAADAPLRRNVPSLWNVAFATSLFWDGRSPNLEAQMLVPLTAANEMNADPDELIAELRGIPEYVERFSAVYGGAEPITLDNVVNAIAGFQRTLLSQNSPFDRFAAGDFNALTGPQRRGFDVFRSAQTRCFECHAWPTFTHNTFHVLGVPEIDPTNPDLGRAEFVNAPDAERAFRVPGLRNVALSAPYMHNGHFATLEEVVDFYADGGGPGQGVDIPVEAIDEKVRGFEITEQQQRDLVAFLYALTDEPNALLTIPERVPSGLPVVERQENPNRALVEASTAPPYVPPDQRAAQTITVAAGESIQAAVDRALPGDVIEVQPGVYHETVYVDTNGITIRGVLVGAGLADDERPWIDGRGVLSDGFNTTGDDFTLENFGIRNTIGNAVLTTGAQRVVYRNNIIQDAGIYGLYPVESTDILAEGNTVSGIADAGIYVGQSRGPIIVRNNVVFENVTGIEIENSVDAEVYDNHAYNNTGGILVFLLPNNPSRVGYNTRVYNNLIEGNNHPNFGAEGSTVSIVPPGTGVLIMTADNTEVFGNTIRDNKSFGVGLTSLYLIYERDTVFDLGPLPEHNWIHDNIWENNGYDPDPGLAAFGVPGADILWTGEGWTNSFDETTTNVFPPILPGRDWADPARRALWRFYDVLISLLL